MTINQNLKNYAIKKSLNGLIYVLPTVSDEKLLNFAERYVGTIAWPPGRDFMRAFVLQIKKYLPDLSKPVRKSAVNFVSDALFYKGPLREAFERETGFSPPLLLVISPTVRCNLRCTGCYAGQYSKEEDLPAELVNRVLEEAKAMGIYFVVISGGEPFSWQPLMSIFEKHPELTFMIYTNGTLITADVARTLSQLGNAMPCISVEGFEAETEKRRGPGVYRKVLTAMANLRKEGCLFAFSATATQYNNDLLVSNEFVDFYRDQGCFFGWYFNYVPIGSKPDLEFIPTPAQREYRRQRMNELRAERRMLLSDFWNDGPLVGCCLAGGHSYLHINSHGDVEPCVFVHFAVDNIKEKSLRQVLESDFFRGIRERQPYGENLLRPCMIIDHPQVLRELVAEYKPRATHPEAEGVLDVLAEDLDAYSAEYAAISDPIWEREYAAEEDMQGGCSSA